VQLVAGPNAASVSFRKGVGLTILSLLVAIVLTSGGFYVISYSNGSPLYLILGGIFMGLGIIAMH
jgi:NO-binding membrane sensor protein with MHYT domain